LLRLTEERKMKSEVRVISHKLRDKSHNFTSKERGWKLRVIGSISVIQ